MNPATPAAAMVAKETALAVEAYIQKTLFGQDFYNTMEVAAIIARAIAQATAELEGQLRQEKDHHDFYRSKVSQYMGAEIVWQERVKLLEAELAALRKDGERLNWLLENCEIQVNDYTTGDRDVYQLEPNRAAIDAAISVARETAPGGATDSARAEKQ